MNFPEKKISVIGRYLLLFLFLGYYISLTSFYHAHLVNGHVLTHSHPFKHDPFQHGPFQKHHHTATDFQLIHHHNHLTWNKGCGAISIPDPKIADIILYSSPYTSATFILYLATSPLRAPPGDTSIG